METYAILFITFVLSILLAISPNGDLKLWSIIGGIFIFLIITINNFITKQKNNDIFMENLNAEYRQLKCMYVSMEEVAKNEDRTRIDRVIDFYMGYQLSELIMNINI